MKKNFNTLKVVLEAAEAVEATIMNNQTLKELGIERKKVPSNIINEKNSRRFFFISDDGKRHFAFWFSVDSTHCMYESENNMIRVCFTFFFIDQRNRGKDAAKKRLKW